jgi:predicted RNA-binding protein
MCQVAVCLDDKKIMDSVMLVEPVPEGVLLVKLFEPPLVVPAVIRQVDLMKNRLILESVAQQPETGPASESVTSPPSPGSGLPVAANSE